MKLLTKIRKADFPKKTELWLNAELPQDEKMQIIRDMILSLPKGYYKVHDREYGNNIVDKVWEIYGWMPSLFIDEVMMLGMQALYPNKIYATFTLGLDVVEIK